MYQLQLLAVPPECGYSFSLTFLFIPIPPRPHCTAWSLPLALAKLLFLRGLMGDPGELVGNRSSFCCMTRQSFFWALSENGWHCWKYSACCPTFCVCDPYILCSPHPLHSLFILTITWCFPCSLFL